MTYNTFNKKLANSTVLTGVRYTNIKYKYKTSNEVFLTGFYKINNIQTAFLYKGNSLNSDFGIFNPIKFPNSYITSPYGPDINKNNEIFIVGNYNLTASSSAMGFLYKGSYDEITNGKGTWITILPPYEYATSCIMHSVMNGIAVGNYGTAITQQTEMDMKTKIFAVLYNSNTNQYFNITYGGVDSISAYGIWYNENLNNYTIAGGLTFNKKNKAYIVDWNPQTGLFTNWKTYKYNNSKTSIGTHFDGITGLGDNKYNLTGNYVNENGSQAFYCHLDRNTNEITWNTVYYPESEITSGNTIINNKVYGVFLKNKKINAFVNLVS